MLVLSVLLVSLTHLFVLFALACYRLFEKEFKAVEANSMVKQEQVKVLTSEVAKYQHHLMLEKAKLKKLYEMVADLDAQLEKGMAKVQILTQKAGAFKVQQMEQQYSFDIVKLHNSELEKQVNELESALDAKKVAEVQKTTIFPPGSPEAKFAAKSPLVTGKNGCPTPFPPEYQEEPGVEDEGSKTDEDVDEDFNYQSQPQPDFDLCE